MKWFLKKITGIAIVNFTFLLFAVLLVSFQKQESMSKIVTIASVSNKTQIITSTPTAAPVKDIFAELKNHNVKSDCWMSYQGHIYDITSVFGTHPGGDSVMLKYCGTDMTTGFDTKDKSSAIPHSANAASLLAQYLIQ